MKVLLNDKVYDVLKWICLIVLPAASSLYMAIAGVWGLSYIMEVVGTITAIDTFLGALIGISSVQYNKTDDAKETEENDE